MHHPLASLHQSLRLAYTLPKFLWSQYTNFAHVNSNFWKICKKCLRKLTQCWTLRTRSLYLWRGVAPMRKGLGKQNFEWAKGWVNLMKNKTTQWLGYKILLSFPKHDSLKYWRLISSVNTICKSIRVTMLIIFRFVKRQMVSPKKVHVQTT